MERRHQPAGAAEVLGAVLIAPEVRARCPTAHLAEGVGKVRANLDLFREIRRLDLNESSSDGAAVGLLGFGRTRWGACACPCQCVHTQPRRRGR